MELQKERFQVTLLWLVHFLWGLALALAILGDYKYWCQQVQLCCISVPMYHRPFIVGGRFRHK